VPAPAHHCSPDVEPPGRRASKSPSTALDLIGATSMLDEILVSVLAENAAGAAAMFVTHGATASLAVSSS